MLHDSLHLVAITLRDLRGFIDPKSWASITFQTFQIELINFLNAIFREIYRLYSKYIPPLKNSRKFPIKSTQFLLRWVYQIPHNGNRVDFRAIFTTRYLIIFHLHQICSILDPENVMKGGVTMLRTFSNPCTLVQIEIVSFRKQKNSKLVKSAKNWKHWYLLFMGYPKWSFIDP